jgi:hypothetical protein
MYHGPRFPLIGHITGLVDVGCKVFVDGLTVRHVNFWWFVEPLNTEPTPASPCTPGEH